MDTLKPTPQARVTRKSHPMKDEIALLPAFQGLVLEEIEQLETEKQFDRALEAIKATGLVGFDTESKPSFQRGDVSDGPHVVQLALDDRAYIIQIGTSPPIGFLQDILGSASITKVGFGLKSDRAHLHRKFGIKLVNVVDGSHRPPENTWIQAGIGGEGCSSRAAWPEPAEVEIYEHIELGAE